MLDAKILLEIKESEKVGEQLVKEYKEVECDIKQGIGDWDLINKLGDLCLRYNAWRENHERLLKSTYV